MLINQKDFIAGTIFSVFGLAFVIGAAANLRIGTAFRMGPGYFPLLLGGGLVALGVVVCLRSLRLRTAPLSRVSWRAVVLITVAPVIFGLTVRGLGLAPATAISAAIAASASRRTSMVMGATLAVGLTIVCMLVFIFGLGLPLSVFGTWLQF